MENKLSMGGVLRIKSPQSLPLPPSEKPASPARALHKGLAPRSATRSAAAVVPDSVGPAASIGEAGSGAGAGGGAGGVPPGAHAPCRVITCRAVAVAAVRIDGDPRVLALCARHVDDACDIAGAFDKPIEVTPCNCSALVDAARAVRAAGGGVAVQGPGCVVHGWQAVRS